MKRRQRKPVLDLKSEQQSESPRVGRWQNKYQQIAVDHPEQNGNPNENPLASLLGQYNSDSETESDVKQESKNKLNDKVNDFLKEIQMIATDSSAQEKATESKTGQSGTQSVQSETSNCPWQECFDETTGYPYYWHVETNEVTWEMPAELIIERDKIGQTTNQSQLKTQQAHTTHAQVQWANYLPNTYPEMQTNIPEGMIPKEVVARNRNRQVGVQKNRKELDTEFAVQKAKKTGAEDYDSDEEKIEMITSFGNDEEEEEEESESETSDTDSKNKKSVTDSATLCSEKAISSSRGKKTSTERNTISNNNKDDNFERVGSVSIGPSLPPGIIPMIHGPENEITGSVNRRNEIIISDKKMLNDEIIGDKIEIGGQFLNRSIESPIKNDDEEAGKRENENGDEKEEEEDKEEEEEEEDIISKIEREMPVDHAIGCDSSGERIAFNESDKKNKEIKISLVAGYSDDSDIEEESSPKKIINNVPVKPLFPIIDDYGGKDLSSLRLSKEAKRDNESEFENEEKEIRNSVAKDGVENDKEIFKKDSRDNSMDSNGVIENLEAFSKPETESTRQNSFLDSLTEIPAKGFQRKKRIAFDVIPNKTLRVSQPDPTTTTSLNFTASTISCDDGDSERHGFGFNKDSTKNFRDTKGEDYPGGVESTSFDKTTIHKELETKKTGINFVKGETTPSSGSKIEPVVATTANDIKTDDDNKELKEFTDLVMEKIKFLSEGSQNLSAIQIMVIQLQTLVSAWEAGELKESYLYEWLKGTGHELGRLEEAAAPPGWDCHWDRSHKRYYYRNTATGEAQWTYPEADVVGGTEEMDLCTTPPPPEEEEFQMIEEGTNNTVVLEENLKTIIDTKSELSVTTAMPSLTFAGEGNKIVQITRDEYKSLEAPPPPQISSPSPPPPPRIYAEDLKKGKKRRGSTTERVAYSETKKEKTGGDTTDTVSSSPSSSFSETKEAVDPPLPPSPPKNATQPPLPPNPPHPTIVPNPPSSEPLPPGVDPKDMPAAYPLPAVTALEQSVVYAGTTRQPNPIYTATLAERGIAVPLIDHRSAIIQGQLMHYPTYQHLHNQAMIAAAGTLTGQEAVQFMLTDYGQVYTNAQVIAKPPVKSQNESLGSALDSFYSDIATIEKTTLAEQDQSSSQQDFDVSSREAATPPPPIALPNPTIASSAAAAVPAAEVEQQNASQLETAGKERKRKRTKIGIGKKQKEMSSMVAKWQKAQQDFEDSE